MPREPRLIFDVKDNKEMLKKAIKGAFFGVCSILIINYLIFCLEDESLLARTTIFTSYSQGSIYNEVLGLWAVSFTPISSLSVIVPDWFENFYIYLASPIIAGFFIALNVKSVKWALVGGIFFIVWSVLLSMVFILILPWFGIVDPASINASLISAFSDVYNSFNAFYLSLVSITNSVFLGWSIAGSIELAGVATVIALPLSLLFGVLQALFSK
ncbi:MAG: hypothetical protein ACTSRZ_09610 [Promethearchaeota archaeon]